MFVSTLNQLLSFLFTKLSAEGKMLHSLRQLRYMVGAFPIMQESLPLRAVFRTSASKWIFHRSLSSFPEKGSSHTIDQEALALMYCFFLSLNYSVPQLEDTSQEAKARVNKPTTMEKLIKAVLRFDNDHGRVIWSFNSLTL